MGFNYQTWVCYNQRAMEENSVTLKAYINRVATSVDGGWRVTIDVPENETERITELAYLRNTVLMVTFTPPLLDEA